MHSTEAIESVDNFDELDFSPLFFLSEKFSKQQLKWHIGQKKLFPVIYSFHRFRHLLVDPGKDINIFTDHASLRYILRPNEMKNRNYSERLTRWALTIQQVRCKIFNLSSTKNAMADLMTRWGYSESQVQFLQEKER